MSVNDGDPAFPVKSRMVPSDAGPNVWKAMECDGMSLRDWFAGQALVCMSSSEVLVGFNETHTRETVAAAIARSAYELADAMLAARDKERG